MTELLLPFVLLMLGLGLLLAEDLLPTSGVLGIFAAACFIGLLYIGFSTSVNLGLRYLVAEILVIPVTYGVYTYIIARTGLGRRVYLQPPEAHEVDLSRERHDLDRLVGQRGRVLTTLRPSGTVDFEGYRHEGVADEGLIAAGAWVIAVRAQSGRLTVRLDRSEEISTVGE